MSPSAAAGLLLRWSWRPASRVMLGTAVALIAALVLELAVSPRWRAEAARAQQLAGQREAARVAAALRAKAAAPRVIDPSLLPADTSSAERLSNLLAGAIREGARIERSQQRVEPLANSPVQILSVQQAAAGNYLDVRRYVAQSLAQDPALALQRIQVQRASATASQVDVDLQWRLVQRSSSVQLRPDPARGGNR